MKTFSSIPRRLAAASACLILLTAPAASARVQWEGDPDDGTKVFDALNFEGAIIHSKGTGSVKRGKDPVYGDIWKIHKPAADKRAEIRRAEG